METGGNLAILNSDKNTVWSTQTMGNPGAYLVFQEDGELVVKGRGGTGYALWSSDSFECSSDEDSGCYLTIQNDCNLVEYHADGSYAGYASGSSC